jgi:hypothetical protein
VRAIGACKIRECRWTTQNSAYSEHAGTIRFESPNLRPITLQPNELGWYPASLVQPDLLPAPDAVVEVSAEGSSDVPAFELVTAFPRDVRVLLPGQEQEDGARTLFGGAARRDLDLDIPIEPADSRVEVSLTATGAGDACQDKGECALLMSCVYSRAPVIVPTAALAMLAPDQRVNIALAAVNSTHTKAGEYEVELAAIGARWSIDFLVQ